MREMETIFTLLLFWMPLIYYYRTGVCDAAASASYKGVVSYIYHGQTMDIVSQGRKDFNIFCFNGNNKHILHLWQTALVHVNLSNDNFEQYDGATPKEVYAEYQQHRSSWNINFYVWKRKEIKLNPFNDSCIGIFTDEDYKIHFNIIRIDIWKAILFGIGVFVFFSAPRLSNNSLFYYISGVTMGICASFLVLVYLISKLLPKRPVMYGFIVGGWTVGVYLLHMLWENLRLIMMEYQMHVLSYTATTGLISFAICYRLGPVTDKRSINLIKWALQGVALIMVFCSSYYQEAMLAIIIVMVVLYSFPPAWTAKAKAYWKRKFPPKVKLLSEDQYHEQGVKETAKALKELREYCSSPECDPWNTMLRLKQPVRFASFMKGTSHLSDDEILEYESESRRLEYYTDDSDEED